jgi:hypothetical protein
MQRTHAMWATDQQQQRMQRRAMAWMVGVAVSVVVALVLGAPTGGTAGDDQDSPCAGLTGACFGLCTAADAVGCFEDASTPECLVLLGNLEKHKCEGVTCSCAGLQADSITWSDAFETTICQFDGSGDVIILNKDFSVLDVTEEDGAEVCILQSAFSHSVPRPLTTDAERAACNASLRQIAATDMVTCIPNP